MSWFAYSSPAPVARRTNDENVHNDSTPNSHRQGGKKQSVSLGATGSVTPRGARIGSSSNHNHHNHPSTTVSAPSPTSYMPPTTGGAAVGRKPVGHKYDRRSPAMDIPTTADDEAPSPNPAHLLDNASPEKKKKRPDGSLVAAGQAAPTHRYDPDADHVGAIFAGKRTGFTPDRNDQMHAYPDDHVGNLMNGSKELLYHKYDQKDDDHIRGVDRYPVPNHYDHGHENHASYYASHNAEVDHLQQATPAGVRGRDAVATANRRAYHSPPVKDHLTPRPQSPMPEYVDRNPVGAACTKKRVGRAPVANHGAPVASRRSPANTFSNVFGYSVDQNAEQFGRLRQSQRFSASPAPGTTTTSHQPAPKSSSVVAECLDRLSSPRPQSRPPTSRDGGGGIPYGAESTTSDYGRHHRVLGGATTTTTSSTARTTNTGAVVPPVMGLAKAATAARDPQPAAAGMTPRQRMLKQFHGSNLW